MDISGTTRVIGFVGSSYERSRIYGIYNPAFRALGIDFVYVPFRVTDIAAALDGVRALGIHAVGITTPFKVSALAHLDVVDDSARRSGAVNVVSNDDGRLCGSNTDGAGALRAIEEATGVRDRRVCLIGSGGAARAIAAELILAGASVNLVGIDAKERDALVGAVGGTGHGWEDLAREIEAADIVINSTPVGMAGTPTEGDTPAPGVRFRPDQVVMDVIATPLETRLIQQARACGARVVLGERMLLWQALLKFPAFTGRTVSIDQLDHLMAPQPPA